MPEKKLSYCEVRLRETLTPEQFRIAREQATEPPFSGEYCNTKTPGVYHCVVCGQPLFSSEHKFDSGSGWPSYYQPIDDQAVETQDDTSHGMRRTEVHCSECDSHLGHVFPDGPEPTGMRYCINSTVLKLRKS
ncbi:MAG: peptide-methionine (R)-S-oxide reductase MsrB [Candidatus Hydrogenedentes bacterium]|nr:peptide-methionine (R)-S-oxide reductase MsrB [Candidatus Hydrogenedentota bacterium]